MQTQTHQHQGIYRDWLLSRFSINYPPSRKNNVLYLSHPNPQTLCRAHSSCGCLVKGKTGFTNNNAAASVFVLALNCCELCSYHVVEASIEYKQTQSGTFTSNWPHFGSFWSVFKIGGWNQRIYKQIELSGQLRSMYIMRWRISQCEYNHKEERHFHNSTYCNSIDQNFQLLLVVNQWQSQF